LKVSILLKIAGSLVDTPDTVMQTFSLCINPSGTFSLKIKMRSSFVVEFLIA